MLRSWGSRLQLGGLGSLRLPALHAAAQRDARYQRHWLCCGPLGGQEAARSWTRRTPTWQPDAAQRARGGGGGQVREVEGGKGGGCQGG